MSSAARASASALTSASAARVRLPWHDETMSARRPKNGTLETGPFETGPLETGALDTGAVETGTLRTVLSAETLTQRELFVYHSVRSEGALLGGVTIITAIFHHSVTWGGDLLGGVTIITAIFHHSVTSEGDLLGGVTIITAICISFQVGGGLVRGGYYHDGAYAGRCLQVDVIPTPTQSLPTPAPPPAEDPSLLPNPSSPPIFPANPSIFSLLRDHLGVHAASLCRGGKALLSPTLPICRNSPVRMNYVILHRYMNSCHRMCFETTSYLINIGAPITGCFHSSIRTKQAT